VREYRQLYARGAYLPANYRDSLRGRVAPLISKYGLTGDHRSFRTVPATAQAAVALPEPTLF
jgi:hypothetical protein